MAWRVDYSDKAKKPLCKLDSAQRRILLAWLDKNINGCENSRAHGKDLVENHSGEWPYRVGHYRILCDVRDDRLVVLTFKVK